MQRFRKLAEYTAFPAVEVVEHCDSVTAGLVDSEYHSPARDSTTFYVLYVSTETTSSYRLVKQ